MAVEDESDPRLVALGTTVSRGRNARTSALETSARCVRRGMGKVRRTTSAQSSSSGRVRGTPGRARFHARIVGRMILICLPPDRTVSIQGLDAGTVWRGAAGGASGR